MQLQRSIFLKAIAGIQYNFKFECSLGHIFICWCSFACNFLSQNHLNSVPEHRELKLMQTSLLLTQEAEKRRESKNHFGDSPNRQTNQTKWFYAIVGPKLLFFAGHGKETKKSRCRNNTFKFALELSLFSVGKAIMQFMKRLGKALCFTRH